MRFIPAPHPGDIPACAPPSKLLHLLLLVLLATLGLTRGAEAQQGGRLAVSDTLWQVHLTSGESYVGTVVAATADSVTIETATRTRIQFQRAQVSRVSPARGTLREGTFWRDDPNATRLFFSPTARGLDRGSGYFGVYELFIPFVAYGVTDRLVLAAGSPFYLAVALEGIPPIYVAPKAVVVQSESFSAAIGALAVLLPEDGEVDHIGIVYGVGTWGTSDQALSAGAGWGYVGDDITVTPVLMLGGESRLGRNTKLISENAFVPGEEGVIVSAGVRFFGERLSADAGVGLAIGSGPNVAFPLVNFVYNFGPER